MALSNAQEFGLIIESKQVEGKVASFLSNTLCLVEQGVTSDTVLVLRKKIFLDDGRITQDDPVSLHLLFIEVGYHILD